MSNLIFDISHFFPVMRTKSHVDLARPLGRISAGNLEEISLSFSVQDEKWWRVKRAAWSMRFSARKASCRIELLRPRTPRICPLWLGRARAELLFAKHRTHGFTLFDRKRENASRFSSLVETTGSLSYYLYRNRCGDCHYRDYYLRLV